MKADTLRAILLTTLNVIGALILAQMSDVKNSVKLFDTKLEAVAARVGVTEKDIAIFQDRFNRNINSSNPLARVT